MRHKTIETVMTREPTTAAVDTGFAELVRVMAERAVSALPVVDADGHLLGVVSEADLLAEESVHERPHTAAAPLHRHAERLRSRGTKAGELMSAPAVTVLPEATFAHAARLMTDHRVKRLPVIDTHGKLVGVLSRSDILRGFLRGDDEIAREVASEVFFRVLGISAVGVEIQVAHGVVALSGQVERRSWLPVVDALTRRVEGVDVHHGLDYGWDDTAVRTPDAMTVDITREPRM
ncbi:CBS domain-containing protein [Actinokineospora sp. NBRC 105648]|uniref:CBS domain-containing protein n=1 Tax=Actinokineospora sp. NBRC 105648 TaxID=3032206 RepID=UPI0024A16F64|nr:CBS domain-containing protein [Actinokineospora sp. NBRC 105648]GLZ36678.1 hypothetical protein Acsp05_03030 [Actinokineospora sp. NBRC 105648]